MGVNGKEGECLVVFVNRDVLIGVNVEKPISFVCLSSWSGNRYESVFSQVRQRGRNDRVS